MLRSAQKVCPATVRCICYNQADDGVRERATKRVRVMQPHHRGKSEVKMQIYPIHVPREAYRGRDKRKLAKTVERNRLAERIEFYINSDLEHHPQGTVKRYLSLAIASDLAEDYCNVQRIVSAIDCGRSSVILFKQS